VGTVLPFAEDLTQAIESQLVGEGYIPCDGRALAKSDTEYQALYQVIGGSYSEDYTSFFVPDYRGRFLRGTDLGAGRDPDAGVRTSPNPGATKPGNKGDAVGSVQSAALAGHTHGYTGHHNDPGSTTRRGKTHAARGLAGRRRSRHRPGEARRDRRAYHEYLANQENESGESAAGT
jgi:microcystin-dependent protein